MIFNIAVGEDDRDGNRPTERDPVDPPAGYAKWLTDFQLNVPNGIAKLRDEFKTAKPEYRNYLSRHNAKLLDELTEKARKAKP
jgi:hypothetical protein